MIKSIDDIINKVERHTKIIVLYSGGLDGTFLLTKLKELGYQNLLALHIDIEGTYSLKQIEQRAKMLEVELEILSVSDDFVDNYLLNAIYSQAKYLGGHPLSASLSRPLIAQHAFDYIIKKQFNSPVLLHTSNSSQNSLRRFNTSFKDLNYEGNYGSPFENSHISRTEKLDYINKRGIKLDLELFSEDSNIWCREFEYGCYDNIENIKIPEKSYLWTKKDIKAQCEIINIEFKNGIPVALNNESMSLKKIILSLRFIAGKYGIGRYMGLEEIHSGKTVLEIRETPAAALLMTAYKDLEIATVSSEIVRIKGNIEQIWVREACEGRWFGYLRIACDKFCNEIAKNINGSVQYTLTPNLFQLTSLKSGKPNYIIDRDDFEKQNF